MFRYSDNFIKLFNHVHLIIIIVNELMMKALIMSTYK